MSKDHTKLPLKQKTNIIYNTHINSNLFKALFLFNHKPLALGQSLNWECVALLQLKGERT